MIQIQFMRALLGMENTLLKFRLLLGSVSYSFKQCFSAYNSVGAVIESQSQEIYLQSKKTMKTKMWQMRD